jgi:predicted  nucleic acid-binding Zn-ribbon protein
MAITSNEVLEALATAFDTVEELNIFVAMSKPMLTRGKVEAELNKLKELQQESRQEIETGIQAKQAEFDSQIAALRQTQQSDFDKWQTLIDDKQAELDAINKALQGQQ